MADSLTDGELTVLGLLAEEPRHGYDLDRVITQRGIRVWTSLGFSSIYYLLDRLAGRGLIEVATQSTGRRRATYRLTAEGYTRCAEQSANAFQVLTPVRARVLIGMANSPAVDPGEVANAIERRIELLTAELQHVRQRRSEQEPLPDHARAIFAYGEAMLQADLDWTKQLLRKDTTMEKYDLKKAHRELYAPGAKDFSVVDVPPLTYLAVDGAGDPNASAEYAAAVEALYTVAYSVKMHSQKVLGRDFVVGPLEGLWRADDSTAFIRRDKEKWRWTMLLAQPGWITDEVVETARASARKKKDLPAIDAIRLRTITEGTSVQILHVGSYDDEAPTLERLHQTYLPQHDLTFNGDHHEIYLSDPRRTQPSKLKTILRQPVMPR